MNTNVTGVLLVTTAGWVIAPAVEAADSPVMPVKAPSVATFAPSWAGAYWGLHLGAALHRTHTNIITDFSEGPYYPTLSHTGVIGGGQIGYNWQHGNLVYGVVADGSFLSGKATEQTGQNESASNRVRWLTTFRGKAGLAAGDTQAYVTAGLAVGSVQSSYDFGGYTTARKATRAGLAVGGGIEHMFGPNWTAFLEALFVDLKTNVLRFDPAKTGRFRSQLIIARAGINKRF